MNDNRSCPLKPPDYAGVEIVNLSPADGVADYNAAVTIAKGEAEKRFEEYMLVSWYDRERDYESPPNTSERGDEFPKDGYIYYGLSHGAKLKVDIEQGRFIFFFTPVEW
ncbi:MAG: AF1514 family protein [Desulfobulbaceae bacterium]|nr:AF1514 family protein [Desulfobulbaceae bacterium]